MYAHSNLQLRPLAFNRLAFFWVKPDITQSSVQGTLAETENTSVTQDSMSGFVQYLPSNTNLKEVLSELAQLFQESELQPDDPARPSESAFKQMYDLLFETGERLREAFPYASTYPDG